MAYFDNPKTGDAQFGGEAGQHILIPVYKWHFKT
jgi:hypothetical protein